MRGYLLCTNSDAAAHYCLPCWIKGLLFLYADEAATTVVDNSRVISVLSELREEEKTE